DVRGGLVQAAGFPGVHQARGVAGDAVRHLVAGDVQGHQRIGGDAVVGIAEGHAEARVAPERVGIVAAVVHAADGADAVVGDAVAAMAVQVVIPGDRDAVVRVDRDGRGGVHAAVAPGVVRIGVDRAHAVLAHAHVGGAAAATGLVDQLVAVAAVAGGQGHGALEQAVADAFGRHRVAAAALVAARLGGMHFIPLGQDRTVAGIDDVKIGRASW